jgi:hypothetical protein
MAKLSVADMQIKVRTPIGLLLVLAFLGKRILDAFEEGRVILEHLPPAISFFARPFPSIVLLLIGIGLILWELDGIRNVSADPQQRHLRHYLIDSGISFVGLLVIVVVVAGATWLFSKYASPTSETAKVILTPPASETTTKPAAPTTQEQQSKTQDASPAQSTTTKATTARRTKTAKPVTSAKTLADQTAPPAQPPSINLHNSPGSAVSYGQQGGITAGTIIGVLPPKPLVLNEAQGQAVTDAMESFAKKFTGSGIRIWVVNSTDVSEKFADDLGVALTKAKIDWSKSRTGIMLSWGGPTPAGLSCEMSPDMDDVANALGQALIQFKVISEPIPCKTRREPTGILSLYITEK